MVGGKLYHILSADTDLLATCETLTVDMLRIKIFWNIMSHQLVSVISISKDCSTLISRAKQILRKVGIICEVTQQNSNENFNLKNFLLHLLNMYYNILLAQDAVKILHFSLNIPARNKENRIWPHIFIASRL
jgi:hypothetical protein